MLKKSLHIFVVSTLLISTTGLTVSKHYCGNKLVTVEINKEAKSCCNNESCCHNETEYFQLTVDYVLATLNVDFEDIGFFQFTNSAQVLFQFNSIHKFFPEKIVFNDSSPPLYHNTLQAKLQVFLL